LEDEDKAGMKILKVILQK